jgi:uncharacterized membrane protein YfcA
MAEGLLPSAAFEIAFWQVAFAAALGGLVRGFSGFGAAMIFMPIASAAYDPLTAVILIYIADNIVTLPIVLRAFRHCVWRDVLLLLLGTAATAPLGLLFMVRADPVLVRWAMSIIFMLAVLALALGWRFRARPGAAATLAAGGMTGLIGGMSNLYGPPVVLFWLGGQGQAATVRANVFVFFGLLPVYAAFLYWWHGMFTIERLIGALLLVPVYGLSIWTGARLFGGSSEHAYRRVALLVCAAAACFSLPLWDR